ncbi:MAG: type IV secretory system conjugative DNA transfer family protein [Armatimonadota bacterium]|nr:type IV secretory system conjugative DNA transfer family protein [Armatimonadota bacterium]
MTVLLALEGISVLGLLLLAGLVWLLDYVYRDELADLQQRYGDSASFQQVMAHPVSQQILSSLLMGGVGVLGVTFCLSMMVWLKLRKEPPPTTYGTARWAERGELRHLQGGGVVFGRSGGPRGQLVEKPPEQPGHVLVVGGTGSGKSRGSAIPTLLRWPGAALVVDVKGELWQRTAGHRSQVGPVYCFDPETLDGDCYDPISEASTVDGAMELARYLIPEPQGGDPFWARAAQGLLAAAALEGAMAGASLATVAARLCETPAAELVEQLRDSPLREARMLASLAADMPEKTLGGVVARLRSQLLALAADPNIGRATDPRGLRRWSARDLDAGATVYLRISERQIRQYKGLFTLMVSQILRHLSGRPEGAPVPVLILLDELPRLGRVAGLVEAQATLRSRNVHLVLVIQSLAQLDAIYGREERKVICDNAAYKLVLSATDPETQKYFSDLAGQRTVMAHSEGRTGGAILGTPNYGRSEAGVPLPRPEEWARLGGFVLFSPGRHPARLTPAWWDQDRELARLAVEPHRTLRAAT